MKQKNTHASYLDVSEFVLKEHSPLFKPRPIDQPIEVSHLYCIVVITSRRVLGRAVSDASNYILYFLLFFYLAQSSRV